MDIQDPRPQPPRYLSLAWVYVFIICLIGCAFLFGFWITYYHDHHRHHAHQSPGQRDSKFCTPDFTVSLNGDGNFSSVSLAIATAPDYGRSRFCIYVKAGRYFETETIVVGLKKTNVVLFGDGIGKTVIASNNSCDSDWCKYKKSTLWILGQHFTAVDLTVENGEKNAKVDAVAVLNMADQSIFLRCGFNSFHTTINAYSGRQLYRECHIEGGGQLVYTADIGARAIFQKCSIKLSATSSVERQFVVATQGREEETELGCLVFHLSKVFMEAGNVTNEPLLGVAIAAYAQIVYMQCELNLRAHWSFGTFKPASVLFGVYDNSRVASSYNTTEVKVLDRANASEFSVRKLFGETFLLPLDVPCNLDLL